jgi:hydrogenase maturation protease
MKPPRVLIAGAGNVLLGDDGFGVEVAARLAREPWPPGVVIRDCGIRGLHLAYELLDGPALLIVIDAMSSEQAPGTLFVLEPDLPADQARPPGAGVHDLDVPGVFATVQALGGTLPRVLIVGCQPQTLHETLGLSPPVRAAVEPAAALVRTLVERELASDQGNPTAKETTDDLRET